MPRIRRFAIAAVALVSALGVMPAATAVAAPDPRIAYGSCANGYFCIYSDWNGGGVKCQWSQRELANTADNCSFIQNGHNVRSVWNKTDHRVQYYTGTNFRNRVGSTPSGNGGNLQGNYQIRSFKPQ